jgi:hypothetical protein
MKELVGREREIAQEKGKKHHPEATRGLGDALGARKYDLIIGGDETISLGVTPQNRHLADYSDQATIYMMSLWKRTSKPLVHIATCTWCGWNQGSNSYKSS